MEPDAFFRLFPVDDPVKKKQFELLGSLYNEWNQKVNLISRNDIEQLYIRHILHSLAIARFVSFVSGTKILDVGTGGGFPGIPLAIWFPDVTFTLCDSVGKKITVVNDVIRRTHLDNASGIQSRAEQVTDEFDFIVSRATAPLKDLYKWTASKVAKKQQNPVPNGLICLKGGDLKEEIDPFKGRVEVVDVRDFFPDPFFETKKIVFLKY